MKIEGDNVAASEVAHQIEILKGNIFNRQEEKYFDPRTDDEIQILVAADKTNQKEIDDISTKFYGNQLNFLATYCI